MNHTIFVLGPSGAGKTTFFASFFYQLSVAGENNFFLRINDREKRKHLTDLYSRLAKQGEWPAGTREISHWVFDCCIQNVDSSACELTLFDYKGGVLTDEMEEEDEDFIQAFTQASAVLAILDGQKVLAFMQDQDLMGNKVNDWIHRELMGVLQTIQSLKSGRFPLHFLISKWDVLEDANYSLDEIKQKLFEKVPKFKALVNQRNKAGKPVYLIPASAVGKGFASLKNGVMQKNPGTIPEPFGVDVPLALALTDLEQNTINPQPVEAPKQRRTNVWLRWVIPFAIRWVIPFAIGLALTQFHPIFGLLVIAGCILFHLLGWFKDKSSRSSSRKVSAQASSSEDAFRQLLDECHQIRQKFLSQFPEAVCTEIKQGVKA